MLVNILIVVAVVIVLFIIIVAMQASEFQITRTGSIAAPAPVVFEQVNDFHKWGAWSPWEKLDPDLKRTYSGPASGVGATYAWAGNNKAGEGCMSIVESRAAELIKLKLEFTKPFVATNATVFTFKPDGGQTVVTWTMSGTRNFMFKMVGLFMNMDKMIGGQFEQGLAQMKAVSEAAANKA